MIDGELREIVHTRDAERLRDYRYDGPDPEGALSYITHRGIDWIDHACTWWSGYSGMPDWNSLYCIDKFQWRMEVAGIVVAGQATFDIQRAQHAWSIVPGWMALPEWWRDTEHAVGLGDLKQEQVDAPMEALLTKWRWCHGEASERDLRRASEKLPMRGSVYHSSSASGTYAAMDAAWSAAHNQRTRETVAAEYKRYCDLFTEYVWLEVMKERTA